MIRDKDLKVKIAIWDSRILGDLLLGTTEFSVLQMMEQEDTRFGMQKPYEFKGVKSLVLETPTGEISAGEIKV